MDTRKVVLVTGSSKGIGYETIIEFAKNGYDVVIHYNKDKENALKLEKNIHKYGGKSLIINGDISDEQQVENMISTIIDTFGHIDVLVNNAALAQDNDIFDKNKDEFMRVLEVNLVGTFLVTKECVKHMNKGTIINISSTDGIDTYNPISMDYCASKAGVISLTKNLSLRFPNLNIYTIAPNWVKTNSVLEMDPIFLQNELNRIGQKELIAPSKVAQEIFELTKKTLPSGSIIRIDN